MTAFEVDDGGGVEGDVLKEWGNGEELSQAR